MMISRLARFLGCLLFTLPPLTAQAQQLEEVVVTAQKRSESLQDVAISIAVVGGVPNA